MSDLANKKSIVAMGLAVVLGISIILVAQSGVLQNDRLVNNNNINNNINNNNDNSNNPLSALGVVVAEKKTVFLHEKPETNLMYNKTSHSYFNMDGKTFKCRTFFDGSIYYKSNDTNYFKCVDRGSTQGRGGGSIQYQVVP